MAKDLIKVSADIIYFMGEPMATIHKAPSTLRDNFEEILRDANELLDWPVDYTSAPVEEDEDDAS